MSHATQSKGQVALADAISAINEFGAEVSTLRSNGNAIRVLENTLSELVEALDQDSLTKAVQSIAAALSKQRDDASDKAEIKAIEKAAQMIVAAIKLSKPEQTIEVKPEVVVRDDRPMPQPIIKINVVREERAAKWTLRQTKVDRSTNPPLIEWEITKQFIN